LKENSTKVIEEHKNTKVAQTTKNGP